MGRFVWSWIKSRKHMWADHRPASYHLTNKGYFWWCGSCDTGVELSVDPI